jgi:hypothetical protein
LLKRVYFDDELAVYYDDDVNKTITWPFKYLRDVWVYTKSVYGSFAEGNRLFAIFHAGKYGGGHPSTYFDSSHDYRSVIDCGTFDKNGWKTVDIDMITHEIAHIVEGSSKSVHESPAFGDVWGDSKWAEIFQYDVYKALNRNDDVNRWYNRMIKNHDDFPRKDTYWFRDWFYPIYNNHGGSAALNSFFHLLSKYFPKENRASFHRPEYTRRMNYGEFFHFWSGAAKTDLKALATNAFGWTTEFENEFKQAKIDFPNIKY